MVRLPEFCLDPMTSVSRARLPFRASLGKPDSTGAAGEEIQRLSFNSPTFRQVGPPAPGSIRKPDENRKGLARGARRLPRRRTAKPIRLRLRFYRRRRLAYACARREKSAAPT
jgi:hypothetical protein